MELVKTKYESMPQRIIEKVKEVISYPRSFRLATEFFDAGMDVIKRNDLYLPFFCYSAILEYLCEFEGVIGYSRIKNSKVYDVMSFVAVLGEEGNFSVDVLRAKDSKMSLDGRFILGIKPGPKTVRLQRIDENFNPTEEIIEYPLEYRSSLHIRL